MTNLINTNFKKLVDLMLYDFLTTGITSNCTRFCGILDENYTFWCNQQKLQAIFKDNYLFIPIPVGFYCNGSQRLFDYNVESCTTIHIDFHLSRIQHTNIYTKDSFLVVKASLYHRDITIVFYLDLIQNVFCNTY